MLNVIQSMLERLFPELRETPVAGHHTGEIRRDMAPDHRAPNLRGGFQLWLGADGVGRQGRTAAYPVPFRLENRHFLFGGTPGSGKTRLFFQIADQARARGDKAFVVDHGGEQIKRNWMPGDLILNPFDARYPGWSPFAECRAPWDYDALGRQIIPDGNGNNAEWNGYAQRLVSAILKKIDEAAAPGGSGIADRVIGDIVRYAVATDTATLRAFCEGDPIVGLLDPKNDKMVGSVRGIVSTYLAPWRYLPDYGPDGGQFSIRDWIMDDRDRRWVFLTYQESQFGAMRSLLSCWLSVAITYALDLPEDESRRIWFLLDELGSLDRISALDDALTKVRKRGGCVVAGLQSLAQLKQAYDERGAQTLLSCFGTWVGLKCGDAETADMFSRQFGEQEIWQQGHNEGFSHGGERANLSSGANLQIKRQRVIDYSELLNLEDLHGYVRFPGDMPIGEITCPIVPAPGGRGAPAFQPRSPLDPATGLGLSF